MSRHLIHTIGIAAGLMLIFASGALGSREEFQVGNLYLRDEGGITPAKRPKHEKVPITARLIGEIGTLDGTHPPALRSVSFDVDKTIGIDPIGLPTCHARQIVASTTATAKRACGDAIVGTGSAEVEVAFPEQTPFSATSPVVLFNGGVHRGTTVVLLHAYLDVPAPTAIVTRATVTRIHGGRFGLHIDAPVPRIAGGAGSVTKFKLRIGRKFIYGGKRKSFLVASCPTGKWAAHGRVRFADGSEIVVSHVFPCTPGG
jgi:hypothetical protein